MTRHRSRFPSYTLFIASKFDPKDKTKAGVAFPNEFGGLNLKLSPGVVLKWNDEVYFNLNPYETEIARARRYGKKVPRFEDSLDDELVGDPPGGDELDEEDDDDLSELEEELKNGS
jgi:hypothetical protein